MASGAGPAMTGAVLDRARNDLSLSRHEVWLGYLNLGGNATAGEVDRWLSGAEAIPAIDHNYLAQALNDEYTDRGGDHPVAYRDPS